MILYIKQTGHQISYRGKIYRTPIKLNIQKNELKRLKQIMIFKSIKNYEIEEDGISTIVVEPDKLHNIDSIIKKNIDNKIQSKIKTKPVIPKFKIKPRARVVKSISINTLQKTNFELDDDLYHASIENEFEDIEIDLDGDDILKQLLANV